MLGVELQAFGHAAQEAAGQFGVGAVVPRLVGDQRGVAPERLPVPAPEAVQRPARQLLAGIPLALAEVHEAPRRVFFAQPVEQFGGVGAFGRTERLGVPFGAVRIVDRNEGRFAAHGQADVAGGQVGVDAPAERFDAGPLRLGIRLGDARRLPHALDLHDVRELAFARLGEAGDRRGRRRFGRTGDRDVPLAGEQAGRRIEADPAGAGQVDLAPGMQVGEIPVGAGRTVERLHVRRELDQVARDEARGQAEMAQHLDQQPGRVAARAGGLDQRFARRLHAGFEADHVADGALHALVERDEEVDGRCGFARDAIHERLEQRRGRQFFQERLQFVAQARLVGEGEFPGAGFEEEIERIDHRHLGDEIDLDLELAGFFRKDQAREIVRLRVLLPVDEVSAGRDLQRIAEDRRAAMRRRAQADDLRREADGPVIAVVRDVVESGVDRHD